MSDTSAPASSWALPPALVSACYGFPPALLLSWLLSSFLPQVKDYFLREAFPDHILYKLPSSQCLSFFILFIYLSLKLSCRTFGLFSPIKY